MSAADFERMRAAIKGALRAVDAARLAADDLGQPGTLDELRERLAEAEAGAVEARDVADRLRDAFEAPTQAEKRLARERLHEILSDVARNDWRPWDCAETLARLMTPEAIKGLALEQLESEGER